MKCESIQTDLTALVFEELDTTRQDEIHLHLAECESCMEEYLDISDICIKTKEINFVPVFELRVEQIKELFALAEEMDNPVKMIPWYVKHRGLILQGVAVVAITGAVFIYGLMPSLGRAKIVADVVRTKASKSQYAAEEKPSAEGIEIIPGDSMTMQYFERSSKKDKRKVIRTPNSAINLSIPDAKLLEEVQVMTESNYQANTKASLKLKPKGPKEDSISMPDGKKKWSDGTKGKLGIGESKEDEKIARRLRKNSNKSNVRIQDNTYSITDEERPNIQLSTNGDEITTSIDIVKTENIEEVVDNIEEVSDNITKRELSESPSEEDAFEDFDEADSEDDGEAEGYVDVTAKVSPLTIPIWGGKKAEPKSDEDRGPVGGPKGKSKGEKDGIKTGDLGDEITKFGEGKGKEDKGGIGYGGGGKDYIGFKKEANKTVTRGENGKSSGEKKGGRAKSKSDVPNMSDLPSIESLFKSDNKKLKTAEWKTSGMIPLNGDIIEHKASPMPKGEPSGDADRLTQIQINGTGKLTLLDDKKNRTSKIEFQKMSKQLQARRESLQEIVKELEVSKTSDLRKKNEKRGSIGKGEAKKEKLQELTEWKWIDPVPVQDKDSLKAGKAKPDIYRKLKEIIIPKISFEDASIETVIKLLKERSKSKDGNGINIILYKRPKLASAKGKNDDEDEDFEDFEGDEEGEDEEIIEEEDDDGIPPVTLDFDNIPLGEALRYVCVGAGLNWKIEGNTVIIAHPEFAFEAMETRFYKVDSSLFAGAGEKIDFQKFFEKKGIQFPIKEDDPATISYDKRTSKLIVRNTAENFRKIAQVLNQLAKAKIAKPNVRNNTALIVEKYYTMAHRKADSTFAIDVDTASYTAARSALLKNNRPDKSRIRAEEFVNYFDYHYSAPKDIAFDIHTEISKSPFSAKSELFRVAIQGKRPGSDTKRPSAFTFVIDTSGSMGAEKRLPLIKQMMPMILGKMKKTDRISLVVCGLESKILLDRVLVSKKAEIIKVINKLSASGATNLEASMLDSYKHASKNFVSGAYNRVILLSDGIANLGEGSAMKILKEVKGARDKGIALTVVGMGQSQYNDNFLETLANKGDGNYIFVDDLEEARAAFINNFSANFHLIARDVKIQLEFNPKTVIAWRQIGYENRQLKKEDFRNDKIDAGEVGAGQSVTAIYEIIRKDKSTGVIADVRVRWKDAHTYKVTEINQIVKTAEKRDFTKSTSNYQLAVLVSAFAEKLKEHPASSKYSYDELMKYLRPIVLEKKHDKAIAELLTLMQKAK
ncbi:MAG: von Willebrand factor type A domain-containing protein [Lentisphaeria bacterium]|nr:von Willebrand factor type A domain-containing protein [Lentisphaeria bacterium]NQZ67098.1 von Willebrand factor type A domain-containing protein [Lentisphaeria bacterium]